jgi:prepilin-type N-terminal cleavage/methylation domain-containing protein
VNPATPTSSHRDRGMTLVEMLAAMAITLIMMGLVAQLFGMLGVSVNANRSKTELYNRMRAAAERLKQDLSGISTPVAPPFDPGKNLGYFEYIEGPESDLRGVGALSPGGGTSLTPAITLPLAQPLNKSDTSSQAAPSANLAAYMSVSLGSYPSSDDRVVGDVDDVLLFTTRTTDTPFTGYHDGNVLTSPVAEVIWYCRAVPNTFNPRQYNLYRRQKIVMAHPVAHAGPSLFSTQPNMEAIATDAARDALHSKTDVSFHVQNGFAVPNSLGDLTKREYRSFRKTTLDFPLPYPFDAEAAFLTFPPADFRGGEDVVLTNCIGFDVRMLEEACPVKIVGDMMLAPGDPGYADASVVGVTAVAPAYVDLNYLSAEQSAVFDTWSTHYAHNGLDDDGDGTPDSGPETALPLVDPLRGIEVRIRCLEPTTRRILQITVRQRF